MAQGQRADRIRARITDEQTREAYERLTDDYEQDSEAVREAVRQAAKPDDADDEEVNEVDLGRDGVMGLMLGTLAVVIAQSFVVSGGLTAALLTGIAISAVALMRLAPPEWL